MAVIIGQANYSIKLIIMLLKYHSIVMDSTLIKMVAILIVEIVSDLSW